MDERVPLRDLGREPFVTIPPVPESPVKAHRHRCLYECMPGQRKAIRECPMEGKCSSHRFRLGHNPNRQGVGGGLHSRDKSKLSGGLSTSHPAHVPDGGVTGFWLSELLRRLGLKGEE